MPRGSALKGGASSSGPVPRIDAKGVSQDERRRQARFALDDALAGSKKTTSSFKPKAGGGLTFRDVLTERQQVWRVPSNATL